MKKRPTLYKRGRRATRYRILFAATGCVATCLKVFPRLCARALRVIGKLGATLGRNGGRLAGARDNHAVAERTAEGSHDGRVTSKFEVPAGSGAAAKQQN